MKRLTKKIILVFACALIFAVIGLYFFSIFGANKCDYYYTGTGNNNELIRVGSCDCFCCDMFNTRGYESCGIFGFLIGAVIGIIFALIIIRLIKQVLLNKVKLKR